MMNQKYSIDWLIAKYENGEKLDFLFFWGHSNKYDQKVGKFCFSQWFEIPFTVGNIVYKTAEHWMMAQKALLFNDLECFEKIVHTGTPKVAKELGREVKNFDEEVWNNHKYEIVKVGNIHKFNQNIDIFDFLVNTAEKVIVEASPVDAIWGIGLSQDSDYIDNIYCWRGQNLLGFALMEVRDFLISFGTFSELTDSIQPPWIAFPGIKGEDMFWKMGVGEDCLTTFSKFFLKLNDREKTIYQLTNPEPADWAGFYM